MTSGTELTFNKYYLRFLSSKNDQTRRILKVQTNSKELINKQYIALKEPTKAQKANISSLRIKELEAPTLLGRLKIIFCAFKWAHKNCNKGIFCLPQFVAKFL